MVDKGGRVAADLRVDGAGTAPQVDDLHHPGCRLRAQALGDPSLTPDQFTSVGGEPLALTDRNECEAPSIVDRARSDFECLQGIGIGSPYVCAY